MVPFKDARCPELSIPLAFGPSFLFHYDLGRPGPAHMRQKDGCAILALREGRTFLQHTFVRKLPPRGTKSGGQGMIEPVELAQHGPRIRNMGSVERVFWAPSDDSVVI